ncbi:MAG: energy transducer TonB [Candidatus Tectomicrobia bacterium]|uniref:Energy transducer TonB n=1 Tax=Tectimicrobiota bacterium TaxID=2528274 RepID=A0A932GPI4_UNCTE|nr:energy transducer TonB [Candidatus Tectomicrobia bacterium]
MSGIPKGNGGGLNGEEAFVPLRIVGLKKPVYPEDSRRGRLGEEGTVILGVSVGADGKREKIRVVKSSGFSRLDQAAIAALESATFVPATRGGKPVPMEKKISFTFRLEDEP